jgi:hypothetical protein
MATLPPIPSGAYPLTTQETDYIANTLHQMIDMAGLQVLYKIQTISSYDPYEHPVITFTEKTIQGIVANITSDQYDYTETGFLPQHYANLWVYDVVPQVGDHVIWSDIEWEVRDSYPILVGNRTVYYHVMIRRILAKTYTGETGGTLQSGGETLLPQDP